MTNYFFLHPTPNPQAPTQHRPQTSSASPVRSSIHFTCLHQLTGAVTHAWRHVFTDDATDHNSTKWTTGGQTEMCQSARSNINNSWWWPGELIFKSPSHCLKLVMRQLTKQLNWWLLVKLIKAQTNTLIYLWANVLWNAWSCRLQNKSNDKCCIN